MSVRRMLVVLPVVGMLTLVPFGPALASDAEFGTLSCPAGMVVWITERTGARLTMSSWTDMHLARAPPSGPPVQELHL